ncbi:sigma-70 family RNA polymerase sigma factor [Calycomorphotria hydatis]|uniref:RNA polymerase sigma factor n=1 Tax=Calycomorphotria hydatis TaxID=2528027 RepID=A0A517T4Y3_9PLAN|nr:sigma-70 family RNA polymerase sigma factor [Calycomorphotria hydatis]QDT63437.1 RNA polymerase sigma factor [Calycomorphotria hydatis]
MPVSVQNDSSSRPADDRDPLKKQRFHNELATIYSRLHALAVAYTGYSSDADEVVQQTCIILWNKFDEFEEGTNFYRWAAAILLNVTRQLFAKRRKSKEVTFSNEMLTQMARVRHGMDELMELRNEQLEKCLQRLSGDDFQLVWDCYANSQKSREYAKEHKISPNTVRSRLRRIRHKLFQCVNNAFNLSDETD